MRPGDYPQLAGLIANNAHGRFHSRTPAEEDYPLYAQPSYRDVEEVRVLRSRVERLESQVKLLAAALAKLVQQRQSVAASVC